MLRLRRGLVKIPNGAEPEIPFVVLVGDSFDAGMGAHLTQRPPRIENHFVTHPLRTAVIAHKSPGFLEDLALMSRQPPIKFLLRDNLKIHPVGGVVMDDSRPIAPGGIRARRMMPDDSLPGSGMGRVNHKGPLWL